MTLLNEIIGRPWAIKGEIAETARAVLAYRGFAGLRELATLRAELRSDKEHVAMPLAFQDVPVPAEPMAAESMAASGRTTDASTERVAVLTLRGMFTQHGDAVDCQETLSLDAFAEQVRTLASNPNVTAVVLNIDSPGGTVQGTPEAAAALRAARETKPFVAYSNSCIASAAYWLAASATETWGTVSSSVGSIGVYCCHEYIGKALEAQGITVTMIASEGSPFKVDGNEFAPLSDSARQEMQDEVNRFYGMFVADVAAGRGVGESTVRSSFGKGRMVPIEAAVAAKMADGVGSLQDAVNRAAKLGRRMSSKQSRAEEVGPGMTDVEVRTRIRARRK